MTIAIPTIHLNGTSADSLLNAICKALNSLQQAVADVAETAPNGRDYYVQNNGAFQQAQTEHQTRMHKLADVIHELQQIGEAI